MSEELPIDNQIACWHGWDFGDDDSRARFSGHVIHVIQQTDQCCRAVHENPLRDD